MAGSVGFLSSPELLPALNTLLVGLTYPANSNYDNFTPGVFWLASAEEWQAEQIQLVGELDVQVDWENTGRIVREQVDVEIVVRTEIPGVLGPAAWTRWWTLVQVIEAGLRDQTSGLPTGLASFRPGQLETSYRVSRVTASCDPVDNAFRAVGTLFVHVETLH